MPKLQENLLRTRIREPLHDLPNQQRPQRRTHRPGEVIPKRAVHEQVQFVLERLDLGAGERRAPGGCAVCCEVVGAGVERAVDVVVSEVHVVEECVEAFGDRWDVVGSPFDGSLRGVGHEYTYYSHTR